jgi:hypothetical protein
MAAGRRTRRFISFKRTAFTDRSLLPENALVVTELSKFIYWLETGFWEMTTLRAATRPRFPPADFWGVEKRHSCGNGGGLKGSTQHFLEVYLQESENLKFVASLVS